MDPLTPRVAARFLAAEKPDRHLIDQAMKAGEAAFAAGRKAVPAHDPGMAKILKDNSGHPIGWAVPLLDAWLKGWHRANVAAP